MPHKQLLPLEVTYIQASEMSLLLCRLLVFTPQGRIYSSVGYFVFMPHMQILPLEVIYTVVG